MQGKLRTFGHFRDKKKNVLPSPPPTLHPPLPRKTKRKAGRLPGVVKWKRGVGGSVEYKDSGLNKIGLLINQCVDNLMFVAATLSGSPSRLLEFMGQFLPRCVS